MLLVRQRLPHPKQREFIDSTAKRKVIRAGRRSGKTTGIAHLAVDQFINGRRVLYATPTSDQLERFWFEVKLSLRDPINKGILYKNETQRILEVPGTEMRIRAKTAWNADTLRGDYADLLILDEFQLMNEETWTLVGAPMLLDNDGSAVFIYTPLTPGMRTASRASDPRYTAKLYKRALNDKTDRWQAFHFTSRDNPHISSEAITEIALDMTELGYMMEIEALDIEYTPGALWTPEVLARTRVLQAPSLYRIVVGVDPQASVGQTGIVVVGAGNIGRITHGYVLDDMTLEEGVGPGEWAAQVVAAYNKWGADVVVGEVNNGGDMVENTIRTVPGGNRVNYKSVRATRGKHTRAEPIAALFNPAPQLDTEPRAHLVGTFSELESELTTWVPGMKSPNRLDAMVWGFVELDISRGLSSWEGVEPLASIGPSRWSEGGSNARSTSWQ